jgi:hypothetical protein
MCAILSGLALDSGERTERILRGDKMGIANHRADIIRVEALEKHSNADALSIVRIGGYQVVVRTDSWKVGDLIVSNAFLEKDNK